jgi:hypothetical protein
VKEIKMKKYFINNIKNIIKNQKIFINTRTKSNEPNKSLIIHKQPKNEIKTKNKNNIIIKKNNDKNELTNYNEKKKYDYFPLNEQNNMKVDETLNVFDKNIRQESFKVFSHKPDFIVSSSSFSNLPDESIPEVSFIGRFFFF